MKERMMEGMMMMVMMTKKKKKKKWKRRTKRRDEKKEQMETMVRLKKERWELIVGLADEIQQIHQEGCR